MYKRNIEARSRYHCNRGKARSIMYSECVSVTLVTQHAERMRHVVLPHIAYWLYNILPHYLINGKIFE